MRTIIDSALPEGIDTADLGIAFSFGPRLLATVSANFTKWLEDEYESRGMDAYLAIDGCKDVEEMMEQFGKAMDALLQEHLTDGLNTHAVSIGDYLDQVTAKAIDFAKRHWTREMREMDSYRATEEGAH